MKINWYIRFKNPKYVVQILLSILTPILGYAGITASDLTAWQAVGDLLIKALSNPYVLSLVLVSVYNATTDPTITGFGRDSDYSMKKEEPTHPNTDLTIKGKQEIDDNTEIVADNTDKDLFEEV